MPGEFTWNDKAAKYVLFSTCTNWKPVLMMPFLHFVEQIDADKPDFLQELREKYSLRPEVETID